VLIEASAIPDVKIITAKKFGDHRGFFSETYKRSAFESEGLNLDFVLDGHSLSISVGMIYISKFLRSRRPSWCAWRGAVFST